MQFTSPTGSSAGAVLPPNYTFTAVDNGLHVFAGGVTLVRAGIHTMTATDTVTASFIGQAPVHVPVRLTIPALSGRAATR